MAVQKKDLEIIEQVKNALDLKFGVDIIALDIRGISVMADYFVIATGNNTLQVKALADAAEEVLGRCGYPLRHSEGMQSANWVLLDFGDIIVHLFDKENRAFYNLERVWGDAKIIQ